MKVSVVIPNYNGEKYIRTCLESLRKQSYSDFETIIIDNASKDSSLDIIEREYPEFRLIKESTNLGFSPAVNIGIREANGEYVVLLNNDTEAEEDWLLELVKCIEKDRSIFSCCSRMMRYDNRSIIDDAGDGYTILGWAYKRGDGKTAERYNRSQKVFSSCGGAVIYRKSVFNEIGSFDEDFFAYMEDVDVSYRAKIYGYENIYCSSAVIYHIGSATSGSKYNAFKVKLAARNNIYVPYKNMPVLQLLINLVFLVLGALIKYAFFAKKGFGKEYREGIKEGFKTLGRIKKTKFKFSNFFNYIKIEGELIANTFRYTAAKLLGL